MYLVSVDPTDRSLFVLKSNLVHLCFAKFFTKDLYLYFTNSMLEEKIETLKPLEKIIWEKSSFDK